MTLHRVRHIALRVLNGAVTAALVGATLVVAAVWLVPRITGTTSLTVLTGSMDPSIPPGSLVYVRPTDPRGVEVGDIITFQAREGEALITHRVTEVIDSPSDGLSFRTKGDANEADDPWTTSAGRVVGEVAFRVPYVGRLSQYAKTPRGSLLVIGVPFLLFVGGNVRTLVRETLRWRRRQADDEHMPELLTEVEGSLGPDAVRAQVALVTLRPGPQAGALLPELIQRIHARVLSSKADALLLRVSGDPEDIDRFLDELGRVGIATATRSTVVALTLADIGAEHHSQRLLVTSGNGTRPSLG